MMDLRLHSDTKPAHSAEANRIDRSGGRRQATCFIFNMARRIRLTEAHALVADNSPSRCDFYFELDAETLGAIPSLGTIEKC